MGIVLPPSLGGLIANYAVMLAGKTPVNLNFTIGKAALEHSIRKAGVKTTITDQTFRKKITARLPDLPWSERVLNLRDEIAAISKPALLAWVFMAAKFCPAEFILRRGARAARGRRPRGRPALHQRQLRRAEGRSAHASQHPRQLRAD